MSNLWREGVNCRVPILDVNKRVRNEGGKTQKGMEGNVRLLISSPAALLLSGLDVVVVLSGEAFSLSLTAWDWHESKPEGSSFPHLTSSKGDAHMRIPSLWLDCTNHSFPFRLLCYCAHCVCLCLPSRCVCCVSVPWLKQSWLFWVDRFDDEQKRSMWYNIRRSIQEQRRLQSHESIGRLSQHLHYLRSSLLSPAHSWIVVILVVSLLTDSRSPLSSCLCRFPPKPFPHTFIPLPSSSLFVHFKNRTWLWKRVMNKGKSHIHREGLFTAYDCIS